MFILFGPRFGVLGFRDYFLGLDFVLFYLLRALVGGSHR